MSTAVKFTGRTRGVFCAAAVAAAFLAGCSEGNGTGTGTVGGDDTPIVPSTQLSVVSHKTRAYTEGMTEFEVCAGTSNEWNAPPSLRVVKESTAIGGHIGCFIGANAFDEVDFSKQSVLLVSGWEVHQVALDRIDLVKVSEKNYELKVNLLPGLAQVITYWYGSIVVDKVPEDVNITLTVTKNPKLD